jgi:hypothetical protein
MKYFGRVVAIGRESLGNLTTLVEAKLAVLLRSYYVSSGETMFRLLLQVRGTLLTVT